MTGFHCRAFMARAVCGPYQASAVCVENRGTDENVLGDSKWLLWRQVCTVAAPVLKDLLQRGLPGCPDLYTHCWSAQPHGPRFP